MGQISNIENEFYEALLAYTVELEQAAKRALYWTDHPEVASQIAQILGSTFRIRKRVIRRSEARHRAADRVNGNGKEQE